MPPKHFDPQQMENAAFGIYSGGEPTIYRLRFSRDTAPYLRERTWHPSQRLTDRRDGGVDLTFTCGESYEVTNWVASWRAGVEALEPDSLRDEMKDIGEWMVRKYAKAGRR